MARWHEVAAALRDAITTGAYAPGSTIPKEEQLERQFGVSRTTVRRAVAQLTAEGLLQPIRRGGTKVREHPPRTRITRARKVFKDDRGYFFDQAAQSWTAVTAPTVSWGPAPHDIARLLAVEPGTEVLIRHRLMGSPGTRRPVQLATSYLPPDLARGTVLEQLDTGPGGIYARLEETHGPLEWHEAVTAAVPSAAESRALGLPPGVALLRIIRTARLPDGRVAEVNDTRMSGEEWEIGYFLERDDAARPGGGPGVAEGCGREIGRP